MDLKELKELLSHNNLRDKIFIDKARTSERYYRGENDIKDPSLIRKPWLETTDENPGNPLRTADNRVACTYYPFMVDQKAVYAFGNPPKFDSGNEDLNLRIREDLGAHWSKTCKGLSINASNCSVAWLHSWIDEKSVFHYGIVDSKQIKAIWGGTLHQDLIALLREYHFRDPMTGEEYDVVEFWDKQKCYSYKKPSECPYDFLEENYIYSHFNPDLLENEPTNEYEHGFSEIPFSAFYNNQFHLSDLENVKGYIDTYDKVFSLFSDNLEDVQQVIFVLENLGGTNLTEFRERLKKEKAVKVINNDQLKTDVRTLTIEIPTSAAESMLALARKNIFEQGQGVDPNPENYAGNTSGEALKYMYANLEQKCTAMKDEFEVGFEHFIKLYTEAVHLSVEPKTIKIVWGEPTRINNITEIIQNTQNSRDIVSRRTLLSMHPYVNDVEGEIEEIKKETREELDSIYGENTANEMY